MPRVPCPGEPLLPSCDQRNVVLIGGTDLSIAAARALIRNETRAVGTT